MKEAAHPRERLEETTLAAQEMMRPTVYGQLIIFLVFVPLLTFQGVEGKTFAPMAITLMVALASAFVLSLTFVPAMIAIVIKGKVSETEVKPIRWFKEKYAPCCHKQSPIHCRSSPVASACSWRRSSLRPARRGVHAAARREGHHRYQLPRALGLDRPVDADAAPDRKCAEVAAGGGAGLLQERQRRSRYRPDAAQRLDTYFIPKPEKEWPAEVKSRRTSLRIEEKMKPLIGNRTEIQQPIQMRFNELIAGVRADVAVKLYGDDLGSMSPGQAHCRHPPLDPGAGDVSVEQTSGAPTFDVKIDRQAAARYGLSVEEVANTVAAALGGREAGLLFEGDRRFAVVVRLPDAQRDDLETLARSPVLPAAGAGRALDRAPRGGTVQLHTRVEPDQP
jgi:cobalt-zinc-cadmium resistance protein CzcA